MTIVSGRSEISSLPWISLEAEIPLTATRDPQMYQGSGSPVNQGKEVTPRYVRIASLKAPTACGLGGSLRCCLVA